MTGPIDREVRIRVEMRNDLSRPAGEASNSLRNLGDRAERTAAQMEVLKEREDALARSTAKLALVQAEYDRVMADSTATDRDKIRALSELNRALKDVERGTDDVVNATKRIDKQNSTYEKLKRNVTDVHKAFSKIDALGSVFAPLVKYGLMFLAVTQELAPALLAVVAGMAPFMGGLVAMPAALMSIVQVAAVGMIAFHGMGQTIKDLTANIVDYNKVSMDMSNMAPAAQQFAMQFAELDKNTIRPLDKSIQQAFFENFNNAIPVIQNLIGIIGGPLEQTASHLGSSITSALSQFQSGQNAEDITTLMNGVNDNLDNMIAGATDLGSAFLHFMALAQPFISWMVQGFQEGAANIDAWVHSARGASDVTRFFNAAQSVMSKTWMFIKNIGVGLYNVAKDATHFSSVMGGGLVSLSERFRHWTQSAGGQAKINQWFQQAETIFKTLATDIGQILPLLGKFSNNPQLANALTQISNAATKLITVILESGGVQFAIMVVVKALDLLATIVNNSPKPLKFLIGVVIGLAAAFSLLKISAVVGAFSTFLDFIPSLAAGLTTLTAGMWEFDIAADANPIGGIIVIILALVALVGIATYEILSHWRGMVTGLKTAYDYTLKPMFNAFMAENRFMLRGAIDMWHGLESGWHHLVNAFKVAYDHTLKPVAHEFAAGWKYVLDIFRELENTWHSAVRTYNNTVGKIPFVGSLLQVKDGNATGKNAKSQSSGNSSWLSLGSLGGLLAGPAGVIGSGFTGSLLKGLVGRWAGGPVLENRPYLVGEKGPEWYQSGPNIMPVGLYGPEVVAFPESGNIVPNHLYDRLLEEMAMSGVRTRQAMDDPAVSISAPSTGNQGRQQVTVEGSDYRINVTAQDSTDVVRKMKKLMRELKAEEEARRIHWAPGV